MEAVDRVFTIIGHALPLERRSGLGHSGPSAREAHWGLPDGTPEPRGRSDIGVDIAEFQGGKDPAGSSGFEFAPMTLQHSRSRHGGPQTAWMNSDRLLYDDGGSTTCQGGAENSQEGCGIGARDAAGLHAASRMRN